MEDQSAVTLQGPLLRQDFYSDWNEKLLESKNMAIL